MAQKRDMTTTQALGLALLALDDQARQPGNLAGEMHQAARVLRDLLRQGRPPVDRDDLTVLRSNLGTLDPGP